MEKMRRLAMWENVATVHTAAAQVQFLIWDLALKKAEDITYISECSNLTSGLTFL